MKNKSINKTGMESTRNQIANNSSIFDQNDFKIKDIIRKGRSENEYLNDYCKLVDYALQRGLKKNNNVYSEIHHILPKCMGGENDSDNYVLFTFLEHIIAHAILYRLYPNNRKLNTAIRLMLGENSRKYNLENILNNESLIKLKSELKNSTNIFKTPIVCCNKENKLLKIYDGVVDTVNDGFSYNTISSRIHNNQDESTNIFSKGYYWNTLENYIKYYPENFNNFIKSDEKIIPKDKDLRIVCYKMDDYSIVKIYNKMSDVIDDGFIPNSVCSVVIKRNRSYSGYYWCKIEEYPFPQEIENYYKSFTENKVEILYPKRIICCDENKNIVKIYEQHSDVKTDGFSDDFISSYINGKKESNIHRGYYWYKFESVKREFSDKINEYYDKLRNGYIPKVNAILNDSRIVCHDLNNNVLKIYKNGIDPEKDGFRSNCINSVLMKKRKSSGGYCWTKYKEFINSFPEKIEEFNNKIKMGYIPNVSPINIDRRIICLDSEYNIINIYKNIIDPEKDGFNNNGIYKCIIGKQHTHKGYYWIKYSDYEQEYPEKLKDYLDNHKKE